jgi:hypothetical protein
VAVGNRKGMEGQLVINQSVIRLYPTHQEKRQKKEKKRKRKEFLIFHATTSNCLRYPWFELSTSRDILLLLVVLMTG